MPLSNAIQQRGMSYEAPPKVEDKIDLLQGVAAGAWSLFDVAALGIPGLTGLTPEYVQYEKLGPAGRVGRVLGHLHPLNLSNMNFLQMKYFLD